MALGNTQEFHALLAPIFNVSLSTKYEIAECPGDSWDRVHFPLSSWYSTVGLNHDTELKILVKSHSIQERMASLI